MKNGYDVVIIDGQWYAIEEVDGDSVWVSNDDGAEFEFPISVLKENTLFTHSKNLKSFPFKKAS